MCNFTKPVNDDKNSIITLLRFGKTSDEVHLDMVPFPLRNRDRLQNSSRPLMFCLDMTANITLSNIASNVLLHVRPPESLSNVLVHLGATGMNRQRRIMSLFHNLLSHILIFLLTRYH